MKKTVLSFLLISLFATFAFTQGTLTPSTAQFYTSDGTLFSLYVNGMKQNMQPTSRYTLSNLTSNGYMIKVIFEGQNQGGALERHFPVDFYTDYVFELRKKENNDLNKSMAGLRNEVKSIFGDKPTQAEEEETSANVIWEFFLVSENHRENVNNYSSGSSSGNTGTVNPQPNNPTGGSGSVNSTLTPADNPPANNTGTDNGSVSINMTVNDGMGGTNDVNSTYEESTTITTTTTTTTSGGNGTMGYTPTGGGCGTVLQPTTGCYPMNDYDFLEAKESVGDKTFSDSKMTLAKQITRNNCLTAAQIMQMMGEFSFESSKLEYAKFAYDFCFDRNNYYKVNDAFTFSSSIDELDEYIESRR